MTGAGRSVRTWGATLALVALALQLVLSFGHVHPEDFFPLDQGGAATALHAAAGKHGAPAKKQHLPLPDNDPICVNLAMVAASDLPAPIVVAPRIELVYAPFPPAPVRMPGMAPRLSFRSRAPPLAA